MKEFYKKDKRAFLKWLTLIPIQSSYMILLSALVITVLINFTDIKHINICSVTIGLNSIATALAIVGITLVAIYKQVKRGDFIIAAVLSAVVFHFTDYNALIAIVSPIIAIVSIAKKVDAQQETAEAQFIFNINDKYVNNADYKLIYSLLDRYQSLLDAGASQEELAVAEDEIDALSNSQISNYLTFFEVLNLLRKKGSVKMEMLDDLFAYRFFIAVRNPVIYRRKLEHGNFENIHQLHDEWVNFRNQKNLKLYGIQCYK